MKMDYLTIGTKDLEASLTFWQDVLGFSLARRFSPRPGMEIAFLSDGAGGMVEFIAGGEDGSFSGTGLSVGFHSSDIEATAAMLRAKGAPITSGPVTLPNGVSMLRSRDPNGLVLGFVKE